MVDLPPAPTVSFASDNAATVHPAVMDALARVNHGHAIAYGDDPWTAQLNDRMRELFGAPVRTLPVWGGTGANVVGLACMTRASDAVVCAETSHIHVDEAGAPERVAGTKLIALPTPDGKLRPEQLDAPLRWLGDEHRPQPKVLSITQSTEFGTLYTADEIGSLCDAAHDAEMLVHLDGARLANAAATASGDVRSFTIEAGVDVLSFGGTKNGMMYGECIVFCRPELADQAPFVRKQLAQLPSKVRYISAQFLALLENDLWLDLAAHANRMAADLAARVRDIDGVALVHEARVNSVFATLPPDAIDALQKWCFFYVWDEALHQVRWMTAWDTQPSDVAAFVEGVTAVLSNQPSA